MSTLTATENCSETPVCPAFNHLILSIARDLMPEGWGVIPDAPDTLPELRAYYEKHGRVPVPAESKHGCTVGDPEAHYAFRAWHDLLHIQHDPGRAFTLLGEKDMADLHRKEIVRRLGYTPEAAWFGALTEIEIVAQNAYFNRTGKWPEDPRLFAVRWLNDRGFARPECLPGEPASCLLG